MKKRRIMIVEDEEIISMELRHDIEEAGYEVAAVATSGEDAVIKAAEKIPDLILMDIQLGGEMNGIEAAEKIRHANDIPVVYLTAYTDIATKQRTHSTQPFNFLAKPFDLDELQSAIELTLNKQKMRGV